MKWKKDCKKSRKSALRYLGYPENSNMPYTWVAREVAARQREKIIVAFDLFNKYSCAGFLRLWCCDKEFKEGKSI